MSGNNSRTGINYKQTKCSKVGLIREKLRCVGASIGLIVMHKQQVGVI